MKVNSPQLGFNNNVRHKGRVFHIQTEDSGVKHPHIITHLFADGGRILKSTKTSYAEFLEDQELPKKVRALMQEQHKAMFIALRAGKFDHMIDGVAEPAEAKAPAKAEQPADSAPRPPQPSLTSATEYVRDPVALADTMPTGGPALNPPPASPAAPPAPAPQPAAAAEPPPIPEPEPRAVDVEPAPLSPKARLTPPPARQTQPPPAPASQPQQSNRRTAPPPPPAFRNMMGRPSSPDILARGIPPSRPATADPTASRPVAPAPSEALQPPPASRLKPPSAPSSSPGRPPEPRPAAAAAPRSPQQRPPLSTGLDLDLQALELASEQSNAPVYQQVRDLPPPPAAVFKGSLPESTAYRVTGSAKPPPMPRKPLIEERKPTPGASRYAPSRPASIFGNAKPQEGSSIFGEDLISEKSLDEVILSYLAEDLEGGTPKK
ncbi:MAG: hypothetical protein JNL21_32875 [Myxococcales bacterium]|nr:hypothetical protein [Myxococcales bacterium]